MGKQTHHIYYERPYSNKDVTLLFSACNESGLSWYVFPSNDSVNPIHTSEGFGFWDTAKREGCVQIYVSE